MSNTIEDKISLFTKVIIERIELDCQEKEQKLLDYYENRKRNLINEYEERKKSSLETARKDAEIKKQQLIQKAKADMRLQILKKRQEFTDRVTQEVKREIKKFIDSQQYNVFLVQAMQKTLAAFSEKQFVIIDLSENDFKNKKAIILDTIANLRQENTYQLHALHNLLGGVYVKSGDGRMEIDYTINSIIEESNKLIGEILFSHLNKEIQD
ncbi:MAG: V-type ATP synthase subunit E [Atribacterota bacterium]|nr:V-type ATP synthase subunit E [Atribacterota bacterium]